MLGQPQQDLANQIKTEKEFSVASNVGLISASDFIKANTNTSSCGTYKKNNSNYSTCKSTNYMVGLINGGYYWMITPYNIYGYDYNTSIVLRVSYYGHINRTQCVALSSGTVPSVYLKSDTVLEGKGTSSNPYTITNYTS